MVFAEWCWKGLVTENKKNETGRLESTAYGDIIIEGRCYGKPTT